MPPNDDFHEKPFDESTLTKLDIFQLYTREWLPVFLSRKYDWLKEVHLYDFFSGPGTDSTGALGSPLRTLQVLKEYSAKPPAAWDSTHIETHFSDEDADKIDSLKQTLSKPEWRVKNVKTSATTSTFADALTANAKTLQARDAAKLLLIDQFGVSQVTDEVFSKLVSYPCTDFLFFIASTTLKRFREHSAIRQKIKPTDDFNQVHHAALDYYRSLLPTGARYHLAPFSIKKGSNIYGIIFGSAHPRGMDKFLNVAWQQDQLNGTANFDINRDSIVPGEMLLDLGSVTQPRKLTVFEEDLEKRLREKRLPDELAVVNVCFQHGVMRNHASPVLKKLKDEGVIKLDFRTPCIDSENLKNPRPICYL